MRDCDLLLWRNNGHAGIGHGDLAISALDTAIQRAFDDVSTYHNYSNKATKVGRSQYRSFQGVSEPACCCKYQYEGTSGHMVYRRRPTLSNQPETVTTVLDESFKLMERMKQQFMCSTRAAPGFDCADFELAVVNQYDWTNGDRDHIPWHDDNMAMAAKTDEDFRHAAVASLSVGASILFCVAPNKTGHPAFFAQQVRGAAGWAWGKVREHEYRNAKGRFAVLLHHHDLLLMTGKFQQYFSHKTWPRGRVTLDTGLASLTAACLKSNYMLFVIDDQDSELQRAMRLNDFKTRWVVTLRMIKYHDAGCKFAEWQLKYLDRVGHAVLLRPNNSAHRGSEAGEEMGRWAPLGGGPAAAAAAASSGSTAPPAASVTTPTAPTRTGPPSTPVASTPVARWSCTPSISPPPA